MELRIDKFGRILIPKSVRKTLKIFPGSRVFVEYSVERRSILMKPLQEPDDQKIVVSQWGIPVVQSQVKTKEYADSKSFIMDTYDDYFKQKLGF